MKPEVLVWALLFVIAVGLAYRLFDRASRRTRRAGDDPAALPKLPAKTEVAHTAPTIEASEPTRLTTAPIAPRPSAPPSAQPIQATAPSQTYEAPAPVLPKLVAAAATAIATRDRTVIVAPDVKATLHPARIAMPDTVIVAPDVKATLPPTPIAMSDTVIMAPDVKATLPPTPIATSDTVVAAPDVKATLPPAAIAIAVTASSGTISPSSAPIAVAIPATILLRGTRLRARRIGQAMLPLDERIKEARSRKLRRRSKTRRKHKSLTKTPHKAPPRRIAAGLTGSDAFASAKAETKIVDAPPKAPRVRIPTVH